MSRPWPNTLCLELLRLWKLRLSINKIAQRLGVSKNAVIGKAQRLNLPVRLELNSRYHAERGIPLNARYLQSKEQQQQQQQQQQQVRRVNGAIIGSTLPPLKSLTSEASASTTDRL